MLKVGLTGGIATGKSTVARMLQEKGAFLIDFDELTRQAEEPGQPAWVKIVDYFGPAILNEDGTIDRKKLGAIVFGDSEKLTVLNEIVHPDLFSRWHILVAEIAKSEPAAIIISDIPLLIEKGLQDDFDVVVLVYAPRAQQVARLRERNGSSPEEAEQRLASQMPIEEKRALADIVLDNSACLDKTGQLVDDLWKELQSLNVS